MGKRTGFGPQPKLMFYVVVALPEHEDLFKLPFGEDLGSSHPFEVKQAQENFLSRR